LVRTYMWTLLLRSRCGVGCGVAQILYNVASFCTNYLGPEGYLLKHDGVPAYHSGDQSCQVITDYCNKSLAVTPPLYCAHPKSMEICTQPASHRSSYSHTEHSSGVLSVAHARVACREAHGPRMPQTHMDARATHIHASARAQCSREQHMSCMPQAPPRTTPA
jgi:hypothetical protein